VTPGVHGNMVLRHVLALEEGGEGNGARTNDKKRGLERLLVKVRQEVRSVERRTVVVGKTPGVPCGARGDIGVANTTTTRPPTAIGICDSVRVSWASTSYSRVEGWNLNAGCLDLGNPLLDLRRVGGRNSIKRRVIGGNEGRD